MSTPSSIACSSRRRSASAREPRVFQRELRMMKARVFVTLKQSVFDPQGRTIAEALHSMGYAGVGDVRQGKYFELEVDAQSAEEAKTVVGDVADKLLANPVIESYRVEVD